MRLFMVQHQNCVTDKVVSKQPWNTSETTLQCVCADVSAVCSVGKLDSGSQFLVFCILKETVRVLLAGGLGFFLLPDTEAGETI